VCWWLESKLSDQLWLSFSLALAKPNKKEKSFKQMSEELNIFPYPDIILS
jgi:hypothetical protein